ncbi:MAG TPA: hypothetical protein VIU38_13390 [Anaerolineales bacterium]
MSKKKGLLGLAVAIALLVAQVSVAAAAPQLDPLVGTIDSISQGTDSGGNTIIIVNYTDTDGTAQVAQLSLADAETLGLISVDPITGEVTILAAPGGAIDLTSVQVDPCAPAQDTAAATTGDAVATQESSGDTGQPVAEALCGYFNGSLGVTYDQLMQWHMDGFGFGVIAQALFMAELGGLDPQAILDAKKGDWSGLDVPEGVDNWGRLRQYLLGKAVDKSTHNLGAIMSGRVTPVVTETVTAEPTIASSTTTTLMTTGHGKGGLHGKGGGHGKGHSN